MYPSCRGDRGVRCLPTGLNNNTGTVLWYLKGGIGDLGATSNEIVILILILIARYVLYVLYVCAVRQRGACIYLGWELRKERED
jgi:hypothetical protein